MPRSIMGMIYNLWDPSCRVRFKQFIPFFETHGWHVAPRPNRPDRHFASALPNRLLRAGHNRLAAIAMAWNRLRDIRDARNYDVVFVGKDLGPGRRLLRRLLLLSNARVVYDYDDAIFLGRGAENVEWFCKRSAWVTPGNEFLADFARRFTDRVTVIPTVMDTDRYQVREPGSAGRERVIVGWSGSDQSIGSTLVPYIPMLASIQREVPFELAVVSNTKPTIPQTSLRWHFIPWSEETEISSLHSFDIGIMPLLDNEFQRGKCGMKLLQYMAVGIPTIASPVGVNRDIILHGETGFLASGEDEWRNALETLVRDAELRRQMGINGRQRCEELYSLKRWGPVLLDVFERVAGG